MCRPWSGLDQEGVGSAARPEPVFWAPWAWVVVLVGGIGCGVRRRVGGDGDRTAGGGAAFW